MVDYELGRPGQKLIGRDATIVINPETNKIVTGYPTSGRVRERLSAPVGRRRMIALTAKETELVLATLAVPDRPAGSPPPLRMQTVCLTVTKSICSSA